MINKMKDPVSALTHFSALLAFLPVIVYLIVISAKEASMVHIISFSIFGAGVILLYVASTVYHTLNISEKINILLKRIDHIMIFILIAGTYTPICLISLKNSFGIPLLIAVWIFAAAGIILKLFWIDAPRFLSTAIYVVMGWLSITAFFPLMNSLSPNAVWLLLAGGITYTVGAVIYALKWPKFNFKFFGFHEIFHLFVIGGTLLHMLFMLFYVV